MILRRLNVHDRTPAAMVALSRGIAEPKKPGLRQGSGRHHRTYSETEGCHNYALSKQRMVELAPLPFQSAL